MKIRTFYKILLAVLLCAALVAVFAACDDDDAAVELIAAPDFEITDHAISMTVANDVESYSFVGKVTVSEGTEWQISGDMYGESGIYSKTVSLEEGDNIYYLLITSANGKRHSLYTVTIRRRPMYTVTFDTAGGTAIDSQQVEEGNLAERPTAVPDRTGYAFVDWNYDFSTPVTAVQTITANWQAHTYTVTLDPTVGTVDPASITATYGADLTLPTPTRPGYTFTGWYQGDTPYASGVWTQTSGADLTARWQPNTDTAYAVKHYQQNILNDEYTLFETQDLTGTSDASVTPDTNPYAGFTAPQTQTVTINPDGSLVVEYYYTRNTYTVSFVTNGGNDIIAVTQKYQSALNLPTPTRTDFTFGGWFGNVGLTTAAVTAVPAENYTVYAWWEEENKAGDFNYTGTNAVTITGYTGTAATVTIPAYIGGVSVTSMGNNGVFLGCTGITSVTIPNGVTNIGETAFSGCTGLASVAIPNSVTSIGNNAFYGCTGLTNFTIPDSVTEIGHYAFQNCSNLASVTIGSGVTAIGGQAFRDCSSLASVTIPDSVTRIGRYAFRDCTGLASVTIGSGVTWIGDGAFHHCENLTGVYITDLAAWCRIEFESLNGVNIANPVYYAHNLYLNDTLITDLVIPNSVTSIAARAFTHCTALTSATIPDSVTSIGTSAFSGCAGLTSVTIPDSVTSIGSSAFYNCTGLTSVIISDSVTSIDNTTFSGCTALTSVTIPGSVTSIGSHAFYNCTGLTSVTIPNSVTSIGDSAFSGCGGLTSITVPDSVKSIGSKAFFECGRLASVTIGNGVTVIEPDTFAYCYDLASITIPSSVTDIWDRAFQRCTGLTSITYQGTQAQWNALHKGNAWNDHTGAYTVHCTDGDIEK